MLIQKVSADRLNPAAYNPRRGFEAPATRTMKKLKRSIEEFGFVEPVVWNGATGNVVGGHQRLKVLLDMGETEIDCVVVDLEPEKEKALNLALNRIQAIGTRQSWPRSSPNWMPLLLTFLYRLRCRGNRRFDEYIGGRRCEDCFHFSRQS